MPPCLSLLTWRLLPHLDEELYGPLGDVEQRGPARDEGLLLHGRRRVHQEHDDRHDGAGEATEKEGWVPRSRGEEWVNSAAGARPGNEVVMVHVNLSA